MQERGPRSTTSYVWDLENRLVELQLPTGVLRRMGYDATGIRTHVSDHEGRTDFLLDGASVIADYRDGTPAGRYTQSSIRMDEILAQDLGEGREPFLTDALGSVYTIDDDHARSRTHRDHDAFGEDAPRS